MTGQQAKRRVESRLSKLAGQPVSLSTADFREELQTVMEELNRYTPIRFLRRKIRLPAVGARYVLLRGGAEVFCIIGGTCDGDDLSVERSANFTGDPESLARADRQKPRVVWLEWDEDMLTQRLVFDPIPDKRYLYRFLVGYRIPDYNEFGNPLPVHPDAQQAVLQGLIAHYTASDDFHMKSFYQDELALYLELREQCRTLTRVRARSGGGRPATSNLRPAGGMDY
jgi:hypothetical protein